MTQFNRWGSGLLSLICVFYAPFALAQRDPFQKNIPPDVVKRTLEARDLRVKGDAKGAITTLEGITKSNPDYYLAEYQLGLAYASNRQPDKSLEAMSRALDIQKAQKIIDYTIFNTLGYVNMLNGNYRDAETNFRIAESNVSKLKPESQGKLYGNMGFMYMTLGEAEKAKEYLTKAQSLGDPNATENLKTLDAMRSSRKKIPRPVAPAN
jgi:Flp pilus assembly protein TadD